MLIFLLFMTVLRRPAVPYIKVIYGRREQKRRIAEPNRVNAEKTAQHARERRAQVERQQRYPIEPRPFKRLSVFVQEPVRREHRRLPDVVR